MNHELVQRFITVAQQARAKRHDPALEDIEVTIIKFFERWPEGTNDGAALVVLHYIQSQYL